MLTSSLRIDSAIKSSSYLRMLLYFILTSILILLAYFANLLLWQYILILIISAVVISWLALSRPILLHLSQPPLSQRVDQEWQILMRTGRGDALWQAQLVTIDRYPLLIHFKFIVVEPYQRHLSITIFRDQVHADAWRELNILATVINIS